MSSGSRPHLDKTLSRLPPSKYSMQMDICVDWRDWYEPKKPTIRPWLHCSEINIIITGNAVNKYLKLWVRGQFAVLYLRLLPEQLFFVPFHAVYFYVGQVRLNHHFHDRFPASTKIQLSETFSTKPEITLQELWLLKNLHSEFWSPLRYKNEIELLVLKHKKRAQKFLYLMK